MPATPLCITGRLDPGVAVIFKPFTYSDLAAKLRKAFES
jgi:hypothetical protein